MIVKALKSLPFVAACAVAAGVSAPAQAQTITGTLTVRTLLPNTITQTQGLDFGVILRPTAAGSLTMNAQTGVLTNTASITRAGGTPLRGQFVGFGTPLALVVITSSPSVTLTRSGGTQTMTINTMRMSVNGGTPRTIAGAVTLLGTGYITLNVGGRLNVGANQAVGTYNGTYTITANYL